MIKRSGYVYTKKTTQGFKRMRREGVIMPSFRIMDDVTKVLTSHYDRLLNKLALAGRSMRSMERAMTTDGFYQEIMGQLQDTLLKTIGADREKLEKKIAELLSGAGREFFNRLLEDADAIIQSRVMVALDKDEVFQQRIDYLMQDYLAVSMDRIEWEENELKTRFLRELGKFATGEVSDLEAVRQTMEAMKQTAVNEARFFARDQFCKLNKSLTLASFEQAEVEWVEWITVGDRRVRPTHAAVNHKVFNVKELPIDKKTGKPLHLDYNCRCALIPVWKD